MLESEIRKLVEAGSSADRDAARAAFAQLRDALSSGQVRAAEPDASSPLGWRVNLWVKQGILLGFRFGAYCADEANVHETTSDEPQENYAAAPGGY